MKNNHTILILYVTVVFLAGCAGPIYKVTSDSPARIEVDGVKACETTPCTIKGRYIKAGFGECRQGAYTQIEAFPLSSSGTAQTKQAFGDCDKEYDIHFEMSTTRGIKTYEGDNHASTEVSIETIKERLKKLDNLLESKVITTEEYKNRRQQILNEI